MRIKILGKYWNLKRGHPGPQNNGLCDHPDTQNKTITVQKSLKDKDELRIILHELFHAMNWAASEEYVDETSTDVANILWKLGYRKINKKDPPAPST
jgi:hypothetical protein